MSYWEDTLKPLTPGQKKLVAKMSPEQRKVGDVFYRIAGKIVDTQIEYTPGQEGRFQLTLLPDGTFIIEFEFPPDTIFKLRSNNGAVVHLGLQAAAAAISYCAMNWALSQTDEAGDAGCAKAAEIYFNNLGQYIYHTRTFTKDEQLRIHRYAD